MIKRSERTWCTIFIMHSRMEGLVLVPRRAHNSPKYKFAQQVDTVETSGHIQRKKHSKTIIYAQLDGKQSSWPPLRGLRSSAPSLRCLFPRHKQKRNGNFGEVCRTCRSTLTERSNKNRMVGGSSPSKTVEIRSAKICENIRLCLILKENNKTGGK